MPSGRWQASYTHPSTGQRQTAQNTFKTKGDATRWLSSAETDLLRGDLPEPSLGRVPFGEYARDWLAAKTGIRQATRELYEYLLDSHILPTFSAVTVSRIDPAAVRAWHANLIANSGLSQTSAAKAYRLLRQILSAAVDDRLLRENPCRVSGAATERTAERDIPDLQTVLALHEAIDERYAAMISLAAFVGLRRGECLGLARRHINLDQTPATISIERHVVHHRDGAQIQEPKTVAGHRTLALPDAGRGGCLL